MPLWCALCATRSAEPLRVTGVASFDGYVFATPEYNHGSSGALENAVDFLYYEWGDKVAGFIG